jgi:outer membrane lipoprotein-sorting protein
MGMGLFRFGVTPVMALAAHAVGAGLADGKAWLLEIAKPLQSAPYLEVHFKAEVHLPESDEPQRFDGVLKAADSTRFRLELPMGTYVSDGQTFWEYHASTRQVIVKSASALGGKALPARMLLDFLSAPVLACDTVSGAAASQIMGEGGSKSKPVVRIALQPTDHTGELDSLQVGIDLKSRKWLGVLTMDAQGGRTLYALRKLKPGRVVPKGVFEYEPPSNAEVVDMR